MNILLELTAKKLTQYLVDCKEISADDLEFDCYKYGIEVALSSLLNVILVLTIGLITNHFIDSIIFFAVFASVRQFTGGYHADTYFKCNLYLCILFVLLLALYDILKPHNSLLLLLLMNIISLLIIAIFSPIENKNKPIGDSRKSRLKTKAIIHSIIVSVVSILMHCYSIKYCTLLSCTLLLISMLIIGEKIKERRKITYEN